MKKARLAITLTPDQEKAIELLASGCTVGYTALVLGLKASIISGWMKRDKPFNTKLASREQEPVAHAVDEQASSDSRPHRACLQ
jgi:hypothetical protein